MTAYESPKVWQWKEENSKKAVIAQLLGVFRAEITSRRCSVPTLFIRNTEWH